MSNKRNIEKVEEELILLVEDIDDLLNKYPQRKNDLKLVLNMIKLHSQDLDFMKITLIDNPKNNDVIYKPFLKDIEEFIVSAKDLIQKEIIEKESF